MPWIAGSDVAGPLDALLARWREHLLSVPEAGDDDTAAVVNWPSRDVGGVTVLIRHGLVPLGVMAARPIARRAGSAVGEASMAHRESGYLIRRAGPADIDEVTRLGHGTVLYDSQFGGVVDRPTTAAALRQDFAAALAAPQPWVWLAERGGTAVGALAAEPPQAAAWIAPMVGPHPVAYTSLAFVQPGERGAGIGAALTGAMHAAAEDAGCAATLLHYEQTNPLSVPFWNRLGYRPVWTSWEARPASFLR
jgi:GNAT superfamily N-acetyltransferase